MLVSVAAAATGGTYYVSPDGADKNPGTLAAPFRTIQRAADVMVAGDVCAIRGGVYRETVTPANSGTGGKPIVFQAHSNEPVEITGCEPVPSWILHTGSVYKTTVNMPLGEENQVLRRTGDSLSNMWLARWPNSTDRWKPVYAVADGGTSKTVLRDAALPDHDWTGAEVRIMQHPAWGLYGQPVIKYSRGELQMTYRSIWGNHDLKQGSKYFVLGCFDALDANDEWFFDDTDNTLYLVSADGEPASGTIEYKARLYGFDLSDRSYITLKGVKLAACNLGTSENSSRCTFDRLSITYPYYKSKMTSQIDQTGGVGLNGAYHVLKNSEISWSSGSGVILAGDYMDVINCCIHDCNYAGSFAAALLGVREGARGHVISHNTLVSSGRSCFDMRSARRVLVQHNVMAQSGKLTGDLGMIYAPKASCDGTEVRYNWLHSNASAHASGIYYDHGIKNLLVHHNVVWGPISWGGIHMNQYCIGVLMFNNTLANSGNAYHSRWGNKWGKDMYGCKFINNVGLGGINSDGTEIEIADNLLKYSGIVSNKYLPAGSPGIDTARVIPGITDSYVGKGPDMGAYERGGEDWTAGHDFDNEPTVNRSFSDCPYMNRLSNSAFELGTLEFWTATGPGVRLNRQRVGQDLPLTQTAMGGSWSIALENGACGISQVMTNLLPGATYEFRGRLRADNGESAILGVTGAVTASVESTPVSGNAPQWSDTRITFKTKADGTSASIYARKTSTGAGTVYLDDFSVFYCESPPPKHGCRPPLS